MISIKKSPAFKRGLFVFAALGAAEANGGRLLGGEKYADLSPERREKMRRCEHDRWMRFYSLYNWRFGETKDAACRRHPCMVSYEQLNAVEKAKDDYAWQLTEEKP